MKLRNAVVVRASNSTGYASKEHEHINYNLSRSLGAFIQSEFSDAVSIRYEKHSRAYIHELKLFVFTKAELEELIEDKVNAALRGV